MVKTGPSPQSPKSYQPSEQMTNFIEEKLLLLKNNQTESQNSKLESMYKDSIASLGDRVMRLEKEKDFFKSQKLSLR